MNRNQIRITTEKVIKELERELKMRQQVYPRQIAAQKLSKYTANERYLIIDKIKELIIIADHKGYTIQGLIDELSAIKSRKTEQGKLFQS